MNMDIREQLAKLAHEQWSGWMKYMFSKCPVYKANSVQAEDGTLIIPKWAVDRWMGQAKTPYGRLSEGEKDSDRSEADRFLALFQAELEQLQTKIKQLQGENKRLIKCENDLRKVHEEHMVAVKNC